MISLLKSSLSEGGSRQIAMRLPVQISTGFATTTSFSFWKARKNNYSSLFASVRFFGGLFEENRDRADENCSNSFNNSEDRQSSSSSSSFSALEKDAVAVFKVNADYLEKSKTVVDQKAFGIPFQITDKEEVIRLAQRHHGTKDIDVHSIERLVVPFWLSRAAAGGSFKAELLQKDPAFMTQQHCFVWVEGPRYDFSYPFEEYLPINQTCACYTEPMSLVESCLCGSHIPSMLVSRFELLQELESLRAQEERKESAERKEKKKGKKALNFSRAHHIPLQIVPFAMSTSTALNIVEKRVTRRVVMDKIETELRKFHGRFLKSNISLTSVSFRSTHIRPVFLPLYKLMITSRFTATPVPMYVCGATGKTVGPVLHATFWERFRSASLAGASIFITTAYGFWTPLNLAATLSLGGSTVAFLFLQFFKVARYHQQREMWIDELKKASILNLPSDSTGFRWTPEEEERQEYEYREHLRQEARKKAGFQQRVKEESRREYAQKFEKHIDPKRGRRTDLPFVDRLGYYAILGLRGQETTATAKEIAKAFRQAVRVHHPDVRRSQNHNDNPDARAASGANGKMIHKVEGIKNSTTEEERKETDAEAQEAKAFMQKLIEAYKTLHNPESRKVYDSGQANESEKNSAQH